jgi:ATP-binding cassette subfamily F protein uup
VTVNGQPKHVLGYLAEFLFPKERAQSPVKSLSGGERNRLLLARLFARPANVLVLDEPTNDLDIETLELLEELVSNFPGTVLLVSHDRVFLDRVVTSTIAFEGGGQVQEYVGGYEDYIRQRSQSAPLASAPAPPPGPPKPRSGEAGKPRSGEGGKSRPRKLSYKEQIELDGLPKRIAALEQEQIQLRDESAAAEFYKSPKDRITTVLARIDAVQKDLDAVLERWVELDALRTS